MFRRTGQGVYFCGEVKLCEAVAKASLKGRESLG